jgi:hypothetical protein
VTTTGGTTGDHARSEHDSVASQAGSAPWSQQLVRLLIGSPRAGESDRRFGRRLALYGPIAAYVGLLLVLIVARVEGEAGLGLTLSYWLFIGVSQLAYILPAIGMALWLKRRGVAVGMIQGAGLVALLNAVAWFIGYYLIGAR